MSPTGTIVQFPSGNIVEPGPDGPGTVAIIADGLHRDLRRNGGARPRAIAPLPVRLDALCGVADDTIARLSDVAASGSLTPNSAARLALRHAKEIGVRTGSRSRRSRGAADRFELAIAGDIPSSFAIRIASGGRGVWAGSAAASALEPLLEICDRDCRAICLLVGGAHPGGSSVRIVATPSWQKTLIGRSCRLGWRMIRQILVLGGLPSGPGDRDAPTAAVAAFLRSRPHLRVLTKRRETACRQCVSPSPSAARLCRFVAIALPGLVAPAGVFR